jgi:hypothetical protein
MATSKIYNDSESAITWKSSGGSAAITCTSLANNAGRVGVQFDRGAGARAQRFIWELQYKCVATPTLGSTVSLYMAVAQSDATIPTGNVGQADAALSALDKRRNLTFLGVSEIDVASTALQTASGFIELEHRYLSLVLINETGAAFSATATDTLFTLTPVPLENQ